jgi:23S rRNA (guanosine2251-2'-O)-methyltransferase
MAGGVSSLNVSAAGAAVLFEAARQRRAAINSRAANASAASNARSMSPAASKTRAQRGLGS